VDVKGFEAVSIFGSVVKPPSARATTPHHTSAIPAIPSIAIHSLVAMALKLPAHLTYRTAIALLPPSSITSPIEAVRSVYDKNFKRWPPHINLLYPFLVAPLETSDSNTPRLSQAIQARLEKATCEIQAFQASLDAGRPGVFTHSKTSKTVWLGLVPDENVKRLQAALQAEFTECDSDQRAFTPHLSLGQARTDKVVEQISKEISNGVASSLHQQDATRKTLDWFIDKVYVIERKGFHGRFTVIGSVDLAQGQVD
jgi:2'-5' RNA ligase